MTRAMTRVLSIVVAGMATVLVMLALGSRLSSSRLGLAAGASLTDRLNAAGGLASPAFLVPSALLIGGAAVAAGALIYGLRRVEPLLDASARLQAHFLDTLDSKYVDAAVLFAAALSLTLELALIRWQSSILEFLALYKNFSLLACFAGLGLGYALARRSHIQLLMVIPLLATQFCFVLGTRLMPGPFRSNPFREQLAMGVGFVSWHHTVLLFVLLSTIFLITALTLVPIGQLCGRLMERRSGLRAYGVNLLGSLLGVLLMLLASLLWTPPLVWFAPCFLAILVLQSSHTPSLIASLAFTTVAAMILAWWPIDRLWTRVYSPYQLLEIGTDGDTGLTMIRAAGHYYQRINDFSKQDQSIELTSARRYYDFPYSAHASLTSVAVVGSGTGNDVAAALRAGARTVAAIEIDPAILLTGQQRHPERPYADPRVRIHIDDARTFLRNSPETYDLIVYGLLDSHTLLSHGSSVRLDSFVYTLEGLREARNRLAPDGVMSLSFAVLTPGLGRKIYLMLRDVFDGRPPICIEASYDGAVIFLASNDETWTLPPHLIAASGFTDRTAVYANPELRASVSTDDWPFFYMPQRIFPVSYLIMIALVMILTIVLAGSFVGESPSFSHLSFLFLGVGFMLVETKGITEAGLTFGNTWQVVGLVISGVLAMAFLGNCLVQWLHIRRPLIPYLCLWTSLSAGWVAAASGGFPSTPIGRFWTVALLTVPLLFSGIVFSTLLSTRGAVAGIMAMNLLGAILGGLLEYNSMYLGFRALYPIALACYILAFVSDVVLRPRDARKAPLPTTVQV